MMQDYCNGKHLQITKRSPKSRFGINVNSMCNLALRPHDKKSPFSVFVPAMMHRLYDRPIASTCITYTCNVFKLGSSHGQEILHLNISKSVVRKWTWTGSSGIQNANSHHGIINTIIISTLASWRVFRFPYQTICRVGIRSDDNLCRLLKEPILHSFSYILKSVLICINSLWVVKHLIIAFSVISIQVCICFGRHMFEYSAYSIMLIRFINIYN